MIFSRPRYTVRLAQSTDEIKSALRLRFEIFNLELHEGLASSLITGFDEDEFDAVCDHLIVLEENSRAVVGTYRMQTGTMAAQHLGYYSAREFDFTPYESLRGSLVELGRACVHKEHRSITVISLLWKEIARYVMEKNARFMIGCSSLTSQDPAIGKAMYHKFSSDGHLVAPSLRTSPLAEFSLPDGDPAESCPPPPKLLRAYLGVGAKICSEPAIDREFKTIDFLTLMDCFSGSEIAVDRFIERPRTKRS